MDAEGVRRALDATGLEWTGDNGIFHVRMLDGLTLDVTVVSLQAHQYAVFGSDRNGSATCYGMKRVDDMDWDGLRSLIQGIAG